MGWTFQYRRKGETNTEFFGGMWGEGYELLDTAQVGFTVYGALRLRDGRVRALVILTRWVPNDPYNFGYKDMDESMGPGEHACPERIFALLTPLGESDSQWAHEWRDSVRKYHEAKKARPRISKGTIVRFERAMTFTDGTEADTFEFIKRNTFRRIVPLDFTPEVGEPWYYGGLVRISNWHDRDYAVIT